MRPTLTITKLIREAAKFAASESEHDEPLLYGITDGKAVGTYLEHKFINSLKLRYSFAEGNSASGVDFPALEVDIKVTSIKQPQSSSPFKSARQKIYGLGYHLLVFVYRKTDDHQAKTGCLEMQHTVFVDRERTADYQMTRGILEILKRDGNTEDLIAYMRDKALPLDDITVLALAEEIAKSPPIQGYLTISNALQWRLQYARAIAEAGKVRGIKRVK